MTKLTKSEEWEYTALRNILFAKKDFWETINNIDEHLILNRYNYLANKKLKTLIDSKNTSKYEKNTIKR